MRETADPDFVQSFVRGLDVIRSFSRFRLRMTLSEVAEETKTTRAATRRFLLAFVKENYAQSDGKYFELRLKVLDLGFAYLASMTLWNIAYPVTRSVVGKTQESCSMAVLDDTEIVYVARVPAMRAERLERTMPEKLTPQTITSEARLRDEPRSAARKGWSLVDQELESGLRSLAVPIRTRAGTVGAAMNLGCHAGRVGIDAMTEKFLPVLKEAKRAHHCVATA